MQRNRLLLGVFFLGLILVSCTARKSTEVITQFTGSSYVTGIAASGETVWCATRGGLVKWDIPTRKYTVYTTANGLPGNVLSDVVIDGKGRVWVGSDAGIAVQEGDGWKRFDVSKGLPSNVVNDLALDNEKNVWASTEQGVVSCKGDRPRFFGDKGGPGNQKTTCILFDSGNNMWIGTLSRGVFVNLQGEWKSPTGILLNKVETIAQGADNSIWTGSSAGVCRWAGVNFQAADARRYFDTFDTRELLSTRDKLWFFTANGVHFTQKGEWEHYTQKDGLISNDVVCGYVESDDRVFAGTPYGFSMIEKGAITNYSVPNTPFGSDFISLATDGKGRILAGTRGNGLNVLDSGAWALIPGKTPEMLNTVSGIFIAPDGSLVFNTSNGIVTYHENSWSSQTRIGGIAGNDVRCGLYDREGRYWVGTSTGISCFAGGSWTRYRTVHGLPSENVWACALDSTGTVWFGTDAGIVSFSDNKLANWTSRTGSDSVDVRSVAVMNGTVYFGSSDGKLIAFDGKSWNSKSKSSKSISVIAADPSGVLWLGTEGDGIVRIDKNRSTRFTIDDGLPSNLVRALLVQDDRVLAACYGGIGVITDSAGKNQ